MSSIFLLQSDRLHVEGLSEDQEWGGQSASPEEGLLAATGLGLAVLTVRRVCASDSNYVSGL